jgi:hypothetical protein
VQIRRGAGLEVLLYRYVSTLLEILEKCQYCGGMLALVDGFQPFLRFWLRELNVDVVNYIRHPGFNPS